jgi:GNAT superfamily N-acetyltransferase
MNDLEVTIQRLNKAEHAQQAYCCMTEVPTPWPGALCACRDWMSENLGRYVEGYHLQLKGDGVIGHLYYAPAERALIPYEVESKVAAIYCEWVQQRYQKQGLGHRIFDAFLEDMEKWGAKGILVEATDIEGQMHMDHYLSRGFKVILEGGHKKLLYRPISQSQIKVEPLQPRIKSRSGTPVEILVLSGYLCPYEVATLILLPGVAREFGDQVVLRQEWLTPESLRNYGAARGIFVNGRPRLTGAESEEAIRRVIIEEIESG